MARYTSKEDLVILKYFPYKSDKWICKRLQGRTENSVRNRAKLLGLKKSNQYLEIVRQNRIKNLLETGVKTRYRKGDIPYAKGKKQIDLVKDPEKLERIKATQFKKGHKPKNTLPIGTERLYNRFGSKYIYIKISEGKPFVAKHVYMWEQAYGPIPKGYTIRFRDYNQLNCVLENMYLDQKNLIVNRYAPWRYTPEEMLSTRLIIRAKKAIAQTVNTGKKIDINIDDLKK